MAGVSLTVQSILRNKEIRGQRLQYTDEAQKLTNVTESKSKFPNRENSSLEPENAQGNKKFQIVNNYQNIGPHN
jgi:hypothetical protein